MANPEARPGKSEFRLIDPNVTAQVLGLAKKNKVQQVQVWRYFLRIGLIVDRNTLVSRDKMGLEKLVSLMDEDFAPEQGGDNSKIKAKGRMPLSLTLNLTEIASKYGISFEELMIRMCKLGIKIAHTKDDPDVTHILKIQGQDDIDFKNVTLFSK